MAPAVVYVHIGSPKTGTTYLQNSLWANEKALRGAGTMLLGGNRPAVSNRVVELLKWAPRDGDLPRGWQRICARARAWSGHSVVISNEHLYGATAAQWDALVDSFPDSRIEVVLTARDLARAVPAQWQSSVRQRFTWTLGEYVEAVAAVTNGEQVPGPALHFWRRQDAPTILRRFLGRVPADRLRVVTVPPSGGDPDELWRRFCRACDLEAASTTPVEVSHESLGAASSELMRRLNLRLPAERLSIPAYKKSVNESLSRNVLAPRRHDEPGLSLPDEYLPWAEREAERVIAGIEESGVEILGRLDDLRPRPSSRSFVSPEEISADDLLEAALEGLAGLAVSEAALRKKLEEIRSAAEAGTGAASVASRDDGRDGGSAHVLRRLRRRS